MNRSTAAPVKGFIALRERPTHLLCLVDGTPDSDAVLLRAAALNSDEGVRLTVAACRPQVASQRSCCFPAAAWSAMLREICAEDLERAAELLASTRAEATLAVLEGCGPREIAAGAASRGCDAILLARRRGRRFARALERRASAQVVLVGRDDDS